MCLHEITEARTTLCKHVFCNDCISSQIKIRPHCPICQAAVESRDLTPQPLPSTEDVLLLSLETLASISRRRYAGLVLHGHQLQRQGRDTRTHPEVDRHFGELASAEHELSTWLLLENLLHSDRAATRVLGVALGERKGARCEDSVREWTGKPIAVPAYLIARTTLFTLITFLRRRSGA
jgi:hypothetical protein